MITTLIETGKFIISIVRKIKIDDKERKKEVSDALMEISQLLYNVVTSLKNDVYPTGSCEAMHDLAQRLHEKIYTLLDDRTCTELIDMLKESSNMEMLYSIRDESVIQHVEKTAGRFYSAALLIKL